MGATETSIAVGSAAIALASLIINFFVVRRQATIELEVLRAQTDRELFTWSSEAIDAFSDAIAIAQGLGVTWSEDEARRRIATVSARLSAVADKGRMFFPNIEHPTQGKHKPEAFQGKRPPILHALIYSFYMAERLQPNASGPDRAAADFFFQCRRLLVDETQRALDPRRRKRVIRALSAVGRDEEERTPKELHRLRNTLRKRHPDALQYESGRQARFGQ